MKDGRRKAFKITGLVIIAAALCAIGYASWNLISTEINTNNSLQEAEQMLAEMNAYTGLQQGNQTDTPLSTGGQPEDTDRRIEGPDDTYIPVTQSPFVILPSAKPNSGTRDKPEYTGILVFESLGNRKVAVLEGADERNLDKGAVHHSRSSPPGKVGNCVIYGHRNTVFRGFGGLQTGDIIRMEAPGEAFTYKIQSMSVVEPGDPVIFKAYSQKIMTLVTCYPFNFAGAAPKRYIVICILQ